MADGNIEFGDIGDLSDKIGKSVEETLNTVAEMLYTEITAGNPVDTGFSRSNWNVSVGEPDLSVSGVRDPKATYPEKPFPEVPPNPDLQDVYVANGVDYVEFLEEGSSQQAPSGFIQVAIDRIESRLQDIFDDKMRNA